MKTHELKTWPVSFEAIWEGRKRFEVRQNDRGFATGDRLILREWDNAIGLHTGRAAFVEVTFMLQGVFGLPPGLCVMSVQVIQLLNHYAGTSKTKRAKAE